MVLESQQQAVDRSKWTKRGKPNNMVYDGELGVPVTVICTRHHKALGDSAGAPIGIARWTTWNP